MRESKINNNEDVSVLKKGINEFYQKPYKEVKHEFSHASFKNLKQINMDAVELTIEEKIKLIKSFRKDLDKTLQEIKEVDHSRELSISITKLQESIMWLGMQLKAYNTPNPYPESYNPDNAIIEKTADDLKL